MVDHAPFFDVNSNAQVFPGQNALMADLNTLDILCIMNTLQVNI